MRAGIEARVVGTEKGVRMRVIVEVKLSEFGTRKLKRSERCLALIDRCLKGWQWH